MENLKFFSNRLIRMDTRPEGTNSNMFQEQARKVCLTLCDNVLACRAVVRHSTPKDGMPDTDMLSHQLCDKGIRGSKASKVSTTRKLRRVYMEVS